MTKFIKLSKSKEKIKSYKLYGFDIETYGKKNKFLMGSIVSENEKYVFWDKKEMQEFILGNNKIRNSKIYATNLGFDFLGLFGDNYKLMSKFHYIIRGSDFIVIKYKNEKGKYKIDFLDTLNLFKVSVKVLGEIIGIPKLKKPKFLGKKVYRFSKEGEQLEIYNIRDSYISFKFAEFMQNNFNKIGCNLKYTIASTSMGLFRRKYLKDYIIQPKKQIMEEMFKGYYGGRVETFIRGWIDNLDTQKYLYDINSLYPYVMGKYKYPFPNSLNYEENPDIKLIKKYEGLSLINFTAPDIDIPLLPYRYDNKLLFPLGDLSGWYSHAEIIKALEIGYKIKPIKTYYYTETFNPFNNFVNELYEERMKFKRKENSIEIAYKILLNSLYGKFAQKLYNTDLLFNMSEKQTKKINRIIKHNSERSKYGKELRYIIDTPDENITEINGILYSNPRLYYITDLENKKYPKFINPIISIYTTSYARLELFNNLMIANKNNTVFYCDTDSIITDYKFKTSEKIGRMKEELKIKKGLIIKPKLYYLEGEEGKEYCKSKGFHNLKSYLDFEKLIKTGEYKYKKFTKFRESLRRNLSFNEIIDVELKNINFNDNKRLWKKNFNPEFSVLNKEKEKSKPIRITEIFQ